MTQAFNLSQLANFVNSSGKLTLSTGVTGLLPTLYGGTNSDATPTAGSVIYGNGSSMLPTAAGTSGQVLTSNGASAPTWATPSGAGGGGGQFITSSGTFTIPTGVTKLQITVIGGGGGGAVPQYSYAGGAGGGGTAIKFLTGLTSGATLTITIGAGGARGNASGSNGGTSSVSSGTQTISTISATGGTGAYQSALVAGGIGSGGDVNMRGGSGMAVVDGCQNIYGLGGGGTLGTASWWTNGFPYPKGANQYGLNGYGQGGSGDNSSNSHENGIQGVVVIQW